MSYFCYVHNWTSPAYSCPECNKQGTTASGNAFMFAQVPQTDREYHGPSGAMIIEENKRLKAELAEALDTIERYEAALKYYCREIHWENSVSGSCGDGCCTYYDGDPSILSDRGSRAREALNPKEGV